MAGKQVTPSSSQAQRAFRHGLVLPAERAVRAFAFAGTDPGNALVVEELPGTNRGTILEVKFRVARHNVVPKDRGEVIVGQGPIRTEGKDTIAIRYMSLSQGEVENAVADQQNVDYDLVGNEQISMLQESSEILETSVMNQLCGYTVVNDTIANGGGGSNYLLSGGNVVTNADAAHHFFAPSGSTVNTTEAAVAASDTAIATDRWVESVLLKLRSLDYDVNNPMSPALTPWGEKYVFLGKGAVLRDIRSNSTDSDFFLLSEAAIKGGLDPDLAAIVSGEGFIKGPVLYLETDYATMGLGGSATAGTTTVGTRLGNCTRSVLLGARAMHVRYGEGFVDGLHLGYTEHIVHRDLSMQIDTVWGCKAVVNDADNQRWGSAVLSSYIDVA